MHEYLVKLKDEYNNRPWLLKAVTDFNKQLSNSKYKAPTEVRQFQSDFFMKTFKIWSEDQLAASERDMKRVF